MHRPDPRVANAWDRYQRLDRLWSTLCNLFPEADLTTTMFHMRNFVMRDDLWTI